MKVDMTLFVQAINFFIAYGMLDRLLMRPAVALILQDRQELEAIQGKNRKEEALVQEYQHQKEENWQECRRYFSMHRPAHDVSRAPMLIDKVTMTSPQETISGQELQQVIDEVAQELSYKVQHEH